MTKCPLISYGKQYCAEVECMGEDCMLWSLNRDACLIRLALLKYTADAPADEKDSIEILVDLLINDYNVDRIKFNDSIAKTLACKMSVKGNTRITIDAMQNIIDNLVLCDNPYNCPHGRPTIITFTKYELEKMFKRVMN